MAHWTTLAPSEATRWLNDVTRGDAPPTFEPAAPAARWDLELATKFDLEVDSSGRPGVTRFRDRHPRDDDGESLYAAALAFASETDPLRQWVAPEFAEGEDPARFVVAERVSMIEGIPTVGPGGRIAVLRLAHAWIADVTLVPVGRRVRGRWADTGTVLAAVEQLVSTDLPDVRLRATFGYTEPSRYERAGVVQPVFVFLLDRPEPERGPAWRVNITVPATEADDDEPPSPGTGRLDVNGCV